MRYSGYVYAATRQAVVAGECVERREARDSSYTDRVAAFRSSIEVVRGSRPGSLVEAENTHTERETAMSKVKRVSELFEKQ